MKKTLTTLAALSALSSIPASATLIAGWHTWDAPNTSTDPVNFDANFVSALATSASAVVTPVSNTAGEAESVVGSFDSSGNNFGASGDGTYGTQVVTGLGAAPATAADRTAAFGFLEETNGTLAFTVTASASDLTLTSFSFDALRRFGGSAENFELSIASTALSAGVVAGGSGVIAQDSSNANFAADVAGNDFDISLAGLADNVLEAGQSATFTLTITGGGDDASGGNHTLFDNVGVFGDVAAIPEPSSALLALLGGVFLIRRRR